MFDKLSSRLAGVVESLRGRGRLTEENIGDTLRQVRMALLEADVALPVVKDFIDGVKAKVIGQEVQKSLTPGQALIKIIHDELVRVMGEGVRPLNLRVQPPAIILLAGLQGAGKTTTAAKIALWLQDPRAQARAAGVDRRAPAGGLLQLRAPRPAARDRRRAGQCQPDAARDRDGRAWPRRAAASTTCCSSTRPVDCTSTRR